MQKLSVKSMTVICTSSNTSGLILYLFILSLNTCTYFLSAQHSAEISEPKNPLLLLKRSLLIKLSCLIIPWENKHFFFLKKVLLYFWLCHIFVATCRLSLVVVGESCSSLWGMGFSSRCFLLWSMGSRCTGFSICSTRVQ